MSYFGRCANFEAGHRVNIILAVTQCSVNGHRDVSRDEAEAFGGASDVDGGFARLELRHEEPARYMKVTNRRRTNRL